MSWYKKYSQQMELGLETKPPVSPAKRIKTDTTSINHVIGNVASMLFSDKVPDETIRNALKDLKSLKDKGIIKFPIGHSIYEKFEMVCKYANIPEADKPNKKRTAFDRLRRIMEDLT